jgi:hypothetical protein
VIERKSFGGVCVNTGCIPTKTLVASAYAAHMARRAADFGVKIPCEILVDMKAIKARKDHGPATRVTALNNGLKTSRAARFMRVMRDLPDRIRSRLPARSSKPSGNLSMSEVAHWRRRGHNSQVCGVRAPEGECPRALPTKHRWTMTAYQTLAQSHSVTRPAVSDPKVPSSLPQ